MKNAILKQTIYGALFFFAGILAHIAYVEFNYVPLTPEEHDQFLTNLYTKMYPDRLVTGSEYGLAVEGEYTLGMVEKLFGGPGDLLIQKEGYAVYNWPGWRKRSIVECEFIDGKLASKKELGVF